jgi:hypothetical protein
MLRERSRGPWSKFWKMSSWSAGGKKYDRAMREQRSPIAVGFKKADIVGLVA